MSNKYRCSECGWKGGGAQILEGKSPFSDDILTGCPECLLVETIIQCCDVFDCWDYATCGTPTSDGYRRTCGKHKPISEPDGSVEES